MNNFRLTFEKDDINGDGSLFRCTFALEDIENNIKFNFAKDVEYAVCEDDRNEICRGGHCYMDFEGVENDILIFLNKLKKKDFPVEYKYEYEYPSEDYTIREVMASQGLYIKVDKTQTKIRNSFFPTSDILIKSIIIFFEDILQQKSV